MAQSVSSRDHVTLHSDELSVDVGSVASLIERDMPEFAGLALRPFESSGSTNALFRLGDDLLVRLPRQRGGGESIVKEARWAPMLTAALPVAVPQIVAVGSPGFGYPERWSVTRWVEGVLPTCVLPGELPATERSMLGADLADVILALRTIEVPDLVSEELRWYRGGALSDFDTAVRQYLSLCRTIDGLDLDLDKAESLWNEALRLPCADKPGADLWFHGDLVVLG